MQTNDKKRHIGTDMPLAVPMMILLGTDNLSMSGDIGKKAQRLVAPLYGTKYQSGDKTFRYISAQLYDNTNPEGIRHYADCDDLYRDILEHIEDYHFQGLLRYFDAFLDRHEITMVTTIEDIKQCYSIMIETRTKTAAVVFDKEFCWAVAKQFSASEPTNAIPAFENVEDIYPIRKDMVKKASGVLYIAGTTLKDAFSKKYKSERTSIINELFENPAIKEINIFLLNYVYIGTEHETASNEITNSISNILNHVMECEHPPKVRIILLSDCGMSFSLLTNDGLLTRSMFLFSKKRKYRGNYLLFPASDIEGSEYLAQKTYFDFLLENACLVDIHSRKESRYPIKKLYLEHPILNRLVELKKIHPVQMENLMRSTFISRKSKDTKDYSQYLNTDQTQDVLLPYLNETERLLEKLIREHDPNGWAKIIPSFDLGFPNNVVRLAGGFATGALYDWSCSFPLIPIDATVNTCSSSVFKLDGCFNERMTDEQFGHIIKDLEKFSMSEGYAFNFQSGNHFLMVAKDDDGDFYLVLHASAKESKDSCFGLYPGEHSWFTQNIKTIYNEEGTRYLRYIRGDAAVKFIDYANRFRDYNEEIHRFIAGAFAGSARTSLSLEQPIIKHHYEMPTRSAIAIGTFVVDVDSPDRTVPVFSDFGKDICLFRAHGAEQQNWRYKMAGTTKEIVLIPHGWGQVIDGIKSLELENVENEQHRKLLLNMADHLVISGVSPTESLQGKWFPDKHIRQFESVGEFLKNGSRYVNGRVEKILHPVFCYCSRSFADRNEPRFRIDPK